MPGARLVVARRLHRAVRRTETSGASPDRPLGSGPAGPCRDRGFGTDSIVAARSGQLPVCAGSKRPYHAGRLALAYEICPLLLCCGCGSSRWDLRARGLDDLPRLEGTFTCRVCGQSFAASSGVLDMGPEVVEAGLATLRRRVVTRPVVRLYEETIRHLPSRRAWAPGAADRADWLVRHAPAGTARRIIDLGCGRGRDLDVMSQASKPRVAVGVDRSRVLLEEAAGRARRDGRRNVLYVRADLSKPLFAGPTFDWASCFGVLHRLADPAGFLASASALLEPGAVFTCLTTALGDEPGMKIRQKALGVMTGVRFFGARELDALLRASRLEPVAAHAVGAVALLAARRLAAEEPASEGDPLQGDPLPRT